jgi:hypothetical protein
MPKLSRHDLANLIATRMNEKNVPHKSFMELGKLYAELTRPSAQKQYRARVKTVKVIQEEAQKAAQVVKEAAAAVQVAVKPIPLATPPAPETVDDIVRKIEQQTRESK